MKMMVHTLPDTILSFAPLKPEQTQGQAGPHPGSAGFLLAGGAATGGAAGGGLWSPSGTGNGGAAGGSGSGPGPGASSSMTAEQWRTGMQRVKYAGLKVGEVG